MGDLFRMGLVTGATLSEGVKVEVGQVRDDGLSFTIEMPEDGQYRPGRPRLC